METATKTRFTFESDDETLVGNLFLPHGSAPAGVVVAVGPLTSVKEQAAGAYAQAMAKRGHAALAFDYRYFGESDGEPRQFENPEANIENIPPPMPWPGCTPSEARREERPLERERH